MAETNPKFVQSPLAPLTAPGGAAGTLGVVTPSDATVFPIATRALWIGVTGNLVVTMGNVTVTLNNVPVGLLNIAVTQVRAATTATNIVALN